MTMSRYSGYVPKTFYVTTLVLGMVAMGAGGVVGRASAESAAAVPLFIAGLLIAGASVVMIIRKIRRDVPSDKDDFHPWDRSGRT